MIDPLEQLCARAKNGDANAASELVALSYGKVFAFFRRLCGSSEDAADLTQKTFAKAWVSLNSFRERSSFTTWIHGIGYHVYVDWQRKRNPLDAKTDEWWETCVADGPNPLEDVAERDTASRLRALVEELDEPAREVVHLHFYQSLSIRETAEILGIATSTVKYRLRAALGHLKSKTGEPKLSAR